MFWGFFTESFQQLSGQDIHACTNQFGFWLLLVHRSVHLCHRIPTQVLHDIVLVACITTSLHSVGWILIHYRVAANITVYIPVSHDRNDYTLAKSYWNLFQDFDLSKITCVSDKHSPQLSSQQHNHVLFFFHPKLVIYSTPRHPHGDKPYPGSLDPSTVGSTF